MTRENPAKAATMAADPMSERSAYIAGVGVSGGLSELDAARQFVVELRLELDAQQRRLDGVPPGCVSVSPRARAWSSSRAVAERVVPRHRAARRTYTALEADPGG